MSTLTRAASVILLVYSCATSAEEHVEAGWSYELQVGVEVEPVYTGSDVYTPEPELNFEASYQSRSGHRYFFSLGEIGADWAIGANTQLRTNLEYEFGRDNADDPVLAGFPEVEDTVEVQALLFWRVGQIVLGSGIQIDVLDRGKGLVGFVGAGYQKLLTPKLSLQTEVDLSFADAEHLFTEVGIGEATAAATGYSVYKPKSGYKGLSTQLGLDYALSPEWSLQGAVTFEFYGSNMSDSPLIAEEGSETTYEASIGVVRAF